MGGKVKQRTKGNTKPSSSGRAAELLSRDGSPGFLGFGDVGTSSDSSSLQFAPTSGDTKVSVHADFQIVMKKLTKRDAVTKLKAVQEFGELCKTSTMEAVLGALPYWPRLYNKLALDVDYRVREATQLAMSQMALRVGRNFAPHLKSIMGVWLCSQCDPYLPVATAAQKAFNAAFSESKQVEVLGFCKREVLEYLKDNLMNQTPDTLSDPKIYEEEDRLTKFLRVISSSLQALAKFMMMFDEEVDMPMNQYYHDLTAEKKFWKLGRHKSPQIRAAFFMFVTVCCQKLPDAIHASVNSVCPIVLGSIDEADTIVSGHMWKAILQVVSTIEDCWKYVNIEKAILPKLWNFLSSGASGNASVVLSSLLPFLWKLPDEVVSPSSGFYQKLFSNLTDGLKLSKVLQSPSECKAVVSGFMDCVQYATSQRLKEKVKNNEFLQLKVYIIEQLVIVVELSLQPKSQISCTSIYDRLGKFLQDSADDKDIENHFWNEFDELVHKKVQGGGDKENENTFQSIVKCLCSLKSPGKSSQRLKPGTKVRFHDGSVVDETLEVVKTALKYDVGWQKEGSDIDVNLLFGGRLLITVSKTSRSCLDAVLKEKSISHLELLSELLKEFCSPTVLHCLLESSAVFGMEHYSECCDVVAKDDGSLLSKQCIDLMLLPLIQNETACNDKWLQGLVKLLFVLMNQVEQDYQETVLENVFQVNCSTKLLYLIVKEILDAKHYLYFSYLHGLKIGEKVVERLKTFLSVSCDQETSRGDGRGDIWKVLDLCFAHLNLLEFFFNHDSLNEILRVFHEILDDDQLTLSNLISIVEAIERFIQNTETFSSQFGPTFAPFSNVILDILKLRLHGYHEQSHLKQCWHSITSAALSDKDWLETLVIQTTQVIKDHLHCRDATTIDSFTIFTDTSIETLQSLDGEDDGRFLKILQELSPTVADWDKFRSKTSLKSFWSIAPFFDGELNFSEPLLFACDDGDGQHVTPHHKICLFLGRVLKEIFPVENGDEDEVAFEQEWRMLVGLELLWMKECLQRVPPMHNGQSNIMAKFEADLHPLSNPLASNDLQPFLLALFNKSKSQGGLWSPTLKSVITGVEDDKRDDIPLGPFITSCQSDHSQHALQTMQALLTSDNSIYDLKVMVESHGKKWRESDVNDSTGQMFHLCLVASALERWVYLTRDSEVGTLECRLTLLEVLEEIKTRKENIENLLLFSCCIDDAQIPVVSLNMAIIRIFKLAVTWYSTHISGDQWDMILCCMLHWLQSCVESRLVLVHVSALANHVSQLFESVAKVLCNCGKPCEKTAVTDDIESDLLTSPVDAELEKLAVEWREFFSNSACSNLLGLLSTVTGTDISSDPQLFISFHYLSETLSAACIYLSVDNLKEYAISKPEASTRLEAGACSNWTEDLLRELSPHLQSTFSAFQVASYRLLLKIIPLLASSEEKEQFCVEEDDPARPPRSEIMAVISSGQSILENVLSEAKVPFGETLCMANDHEALHISRAYLLSWKLLLSYFVSSSEVLRVEYANYLHRGKHLNALLEILFRILPKKPSVGKRVAETSQDEKCLLDEEFVHCLAFESYYDLVRTLPALVRQWWNNLDKNQAMIVERYTTVNVSPLLCEKEMQTVQRCSASFNNMEIVTRSSTREVMAYYKIEDISIELIVSLSASHPLGLITVNSGKRVGVKINQWRLWMMQLTTFLMHQNGTIMEGLQLWKRNMDKKFEGVDDCMICFSVIHGSNYSLPKLCCKTCKKKFHSACLYRWFSTSNNSTCPLCRNLF